MEHTCDCCPEPAVVHERLVHNGVQTEVHLCHRHAVERGYILPTPQGPALVAGKLMQAAQAAAARAVRACPTCGTTMAMVRDTGLAGCPQCYEFFEGDLGAVVERAQAGANVHTGRHPARASSLIDSAALRNRLARELREAVAAEQYERAASLRDHLQSLGAGESLGASGESAP